MSYADQEFKQSSKFLKIEANAPAVIRLLDENPVEVLKHSTGKIMIECKGDVCPMCSDGDEPKQKFIVNVYNHTLHKVQLFEYGQMIGKGFQKIAVNLAEEDKNIMDFDLKLEAEGSGLQTRYSVTARTTSLPVPEGLQKFPIDIPF